MKKFVWAAIIGAFGLLGSGLGNVQAAATTNGVTSVFAVVGLFSPTNSPVAITNSAGTVVTKTYTVRPVKITTQDILNLLATEFGTNFPTGARLAFSLSGSESFAVLDKNGNIFLDVSTNAADSSYRFNVTNTDYHVTAIGKAIQTQNSSTTNTVEMVTESASDYAVYYADGSGNNFHFSGLLTLKANIFQDPSITEYKTVSILLSGSGGGIFYNPADTNYDDGVFTKAMWNASGKGLTQ